MRKLPLAMALAALLPSVPASAQAGVEARDPSLSFALRCSAAFAVLANEQERGVAAARAYPDVQLRGREYFVRTNAALMDAEGLSREEVAAEMRAQVAGLQEEAVQSPDPAAYRDEVLSPCFTLLDAALPPTLLPPPK